MSTGGFLYCVLHILLGLTLAVWASNLADLSLCPPVDGNDTLLFPNPDNCSTYFQCSNGIAIEMRCPDGLLYNSQKRSCDWSGNVQCYDSDEPTVIAYPVSCGEESIKSDPYDCASFLYCLYNDYAIILNCPKGLWFNNKLLVCDYPENVDCQKDNLTAFEYKTFNIIL